MAKAEILLVGTFHLASPNRDLHNPEFDDMLGPRRQDEIRRVADGLARFGPTQVAVEWPHNLADRLNDRYEQYVKGEAELSASETEQIGFRVAAASGIARLTPIDIEGSWYDPAIEDLIAADDELAARWRAMFDDGARSEHALTETLKHATVGAALQSINSPDSRRSELAGYLTYNLWVNEPGNWVGADMVASWFERNMRIAATLDRLTTAGDRVLVIYGAGHAPLLDYFWGWNPRMMLVAPTDYLTA